MDQSPAQPAATTAAPDTRGEEAYPTPAGEDADVQAFAGFDGALRGYDRRQVNKYVTKTQKRIEELTAELASVRQNEQILTSRVDDLTRAAAMCTCDPNKPESVVVGARLRQIIDIATAEAGDLRAHAQAESQAMREEAEAILTSARKQAEQATAALEAMLAQRRAAEEAAEAERRAAVDGWAERHVNEARETARRVIERAGAVSSQVIASARWLVDALGAHRDALSEQLGGVQRRIDELPSLEVAAAVPGEHLLAALADNPEIPAPEKDGEPDSLPPRPDQEDQPVRGVVRMPGAHAANEAAPGNSLEGAAVGPDEAQLQGSTGRQAAHAAPVDRTWTPVNSRTGGAHRG